MRIPFVKNDKPVIKKIVKAVHKLTGKIHNHHELLEQFAKAAGYLDYKQLKRLMSQDISSKGTLQEFHEKIEQWLCDLNVDQPSRAVNRLNLSRLSAFLKPNPTFTPTLLIIDEFGMHMDSFAEANNDDISNLLRELGLPRYRWHVSHYTDIDQPSVVVLDRIAPKIREVLKQPDFVHMNDLSPTLRKPCQDKLTSIILDEIVPQSLLSARDWVNTLAEHFRDGPFGFMIVKGKSSDANTDLWALYHEPTSGFAPYVWTELEKAKQAMAEITSLCKVMISPDHSIDHNGIFELPGIVINKKVSLSITKGLITGFEGSDSLTLNQKDGPVDYLVIEYSKSSLSMDSLAKLPFQYLNNDENAYLYPNLPTNYQSISTFMDQDSYTSLTHVNNRLKGLKAYSRDRLKEANLQPIADYLASALPSLLKENEDLDVSDLWVDSVDDLIRSFPSLTKHFSFAQVDEWHDYVACSLNRYKNRGDIYAGETEVCAALLWKSLFGHFPENNLTMDVASIALSYGIENNLSDYSVLLDAVNSLHATWQEHDVLVYQIRDISEGLRKLKRPDGFVSVGSEHLTRTDVFRIGRKYNAG